MGVENAQFISKLNDQNPSSLDKLQEGDNHLRLIKGALKRTLPRFDAELLISAAQMNKLYTYLFAIEDAAEEPENLERFTVLGDAEFRQDIYMTEGEDDTGDTPSTPDSPRITGLADIPFSTIEEEDPAEISDEKNSRAINLKTADKRYLLKTAEGEIAGGINKLTWKDGDNYIAVATATEDTLTVKSKLVADVVQGSGAGKIDFKEGTGELKTLKLTGDLTVGGSIFRGSDRRIKSEIKDLSSSIDKLRPVSYIKQGKTEFGLIAQEIPQEFAHLVAEDSEGYLAVDYTQLIPVLLKEIQDLKKTVENCKCHDKQ